MSEKEARRVYVIEQLVEGNLKVFEAAATLGLSNRQILRLKKGWMEEGVATLAHGNRGRVPNHATKPETRKLVLELAQSVYRETSCIHMAELLAEHHGIKMSGKTVSRILKAAGIPLRYSRKAAKRRRTRDRMPQPGLLVQMDASPFDWLGERGPHMHLHGIIDDATSTVLGLHFGLQEEMVTYFCVLRHTLEKYGVPRSIYTDRHTMFFSPKKDRLTIEDELTGNRAPLTQIGRALEALGIEHIPARSPQAKGRIERLWGTLQSRLVVEMRVAGISTLEGANAFLVDFTTRFNERFAVEPQQTTSAFKPTPPRETLDRELSVHHLRKATKGSTISYSNAIYQLIDNHGQTVPLRHRANITVVSGPKGGLSAIYEDKTFPLRKAPKPQRIAAEKSVEKPAQSNKPNVPAPDHPWRIPFDKSQPIAAGHVERYYDKMANDVLTDIWAQIYAER